MNDLILNVALLQVGLPVLLVVAHTFITSTSRLAMPLGPERYLVTIGGDPVWFTIDVELGVRNNRFAVTP